MIVPSESGDWRSRLPWPETGTHKHARGRLAVVSGPAHRTGAARLAARAGLRIGAGLVRVMATSAAIPVLAASLEAVMVESYDGADDLGRRLREADAVVIGPAAGLGEETVSNLQALARTVALLVVDAEEGLVASQVSFSGVVVTSTGVTQMDADSAAVVVTFTFVVDTAATDPSTVASRVIVDLARSGSSWVASDLAEIPQVEASVGAPTDGSGATPSPEVTP